MNRLLPTALLTAALLAPAAASADVIIQVDVTIEAVNEQRFLSAPGGSDEGELNADATYAAGDETFRLLLHEDETFNLRSTHDRYMVAEDAGGEDVNANRGSARSWERFGMYGHGDEQGMLSFQTKDGHWLEAVDGELTATATSPNDPDAKFFVRVVEDVRGTPMWPEAGDVTVTGANNSSVELGDYDGLINRDVYGTVRDLQGTAATIALANGNRLLHHSMTQPVPLSGRAEVVIGRAGSSRPDGFDLLTHAADGTTEQALPDHIQYLHLKDAEGFEWGGIDVEPSEDEDAIIVFDHHTGWIYGNQPSHNMGQDYEGTFALPSGSESTIAASTEVEDVTVRPLLWTNGPRGAELGNGAVELTIHGEQYMGVNRARVLRGGLTAASLGTSVFEGEMSLEVSMGTRYHEMDLKDVYGVWTRNSNGSEHRIEFTGTWTEGPQELLADMRTITSDSVGVEGVIDVANPENSWIRMDTWDAMTDAGDEVGYDLLLDSNGTSIAPMD